MGVSIDECQVHTCCLLCHTAGVARPVDREHDAGGPYTQTGRRGSFQGVIKAFEEEKVNVLAWRCATALRVSCGIYSTTVAGCSMIRPRSVLPLVVGLTFHSFVTYGWKIGLSDTPAWQEQAPVVASLVGAVLKCFLA